MIYFDELLNYRTYLWNELLALFEILERTGFGVEPLAVHHRVRTVEETLTLLNQARFPSWQSDKACGFRVHAALRVIERNTDLEILELPHVRKRAAELAQSFEQATQAHMPEHQASFASI